MIGTVFCSQALSKWLQRIYLDILLVLFPKDRLLKPLILKNLENHQIKNMKSNLMFCVTITFLVYLGTNFSSQQKYLFQMADIMFGSDINFRSLSEGAETVIDEIKIKETIQPLLVDNGGKVQNYTMLSSSIPL